MKMHLLMLILATSIWMPTAEAAENNVELQKLFEADQNARRATELGLVHAFGITE